MKDERLQRLQREIDRHQAAFMARCDGVTFDVLFEKPGQQSRPDRRPLALSATGAQSMAPSSLIGEIAPVTITEVGSNSLFGTLANAAGRAAEHRPT